MTSRTEDCIAMLPTGNLSGTVKMMSIATGKIVSRDQFIILPMPSSVIAKLNELACKEGRHVKINGRGTYDGEPLNSVDLPSFAEAPTGPVSDPIVAYDTYRTYKPYKLSPTRILYLDTMQSSPCFLRLYAVR